MSYSTPDLGYDYAALEPHIDARTMEIHHDKHHVGYTAKLNAAVSGTALAERTPEALLSGLKALPADVQNAVRNNGGGHVNHGLFWEVLSPGGSSEPVGELGKRLSDTFGGFEQFRKLFSDSAASRFGSGWAWLVKSGDRLKVYSTANQDSPLSQNDVPLLGLDVWEHAYYLNYQNRRPEYIAAFFKIINWDVVEQKFLTAR